MLVVAALGGNALLRRGQPADARTQRRNVALAARALAPLAAEHQLVITHGNGPQVGLLALQSEACDEVPAYPLDLLGAETEGLIGYLLEQGIRNELPERRVATLLTQVIVAADDPAFAVPTKPIGPVYDHPEALRLAATRGWSVAPDGARWRRVVPSPEPREIVELEAIRTLIGAGSIVVCVGGGGVPVVAERDGSLRGVEAVIDKDFAAALLARELGAGALLLLTDVPAIELDWGAGHPKPLHRVTPDELKLLDLPAGSMGPKAAAAARFVRETGAFAAIGALGNARAILAGCAGTRIVPCAEPAGQSVPGTDVTLSSGLL